MRNMVMALLVIMLLGFSATTFASSWDIVGKVLTGVEGARILTGGKLDVIGSLTGIGNDRQDVVVRERRTYVVESPVACERVWVPNYTYREVWVPAHTEHDPRLGNIFIEGHYVRYQVENGGYWAYESHNKAHDRYSRRGRR